MLELKDRSYLNNTLEFFKTLFSNNRMDRNLLNDILTIVKNNFAFIDGSNVIPVANLLRNHAFRLIYVPNPDSEICEKVDFIRDKILEFTNKRERGYIHSFLRAGNLEGVRALVRLDLRHLEKPGPNNQKALDYASKSRKVYDHRIIAYLKMFQGHPISNLEDIVCSKGNPPKDLERGEGLLLSMHRLGLSILERFSYNEVIYHFTQTFKLKDPFQGRPLIFAWVELNGKFYPRLFWLSQSQGVWRRVDKCFKNWIGKSERGETGTAVPIDVNFQMYKVHQHTLQKKKFNALSPVPGEKFLKYVVAWSEHDVERRAEINSEGRKVLPILKEVDGNQHEESDYTDLGASSFQDNSEIEEIVLGHADLPQNPSKNTFRNEKDLPAFDKCEKQDIIDSPLYGSLKARVIPSKGGNFRYLFLEKEVEGQRFAFLAAVEQTENTVTEFGLHAEWVDPGSLALPLYEYPKQFNVENDFLPTKEQFDSAPSSYTFTGNYLREMPFIKAYLESFKPEEERRHPQKSRTRPSPKPKKSAKKERGLHRGKRE
ncbi:MAG: hypothetical protein ACSNEK_09835 [Parachlamydiaceae bacterium]